MQMPKKNKGRTAKRRARETCCAVQKKKSSSKKRLSKMSTGKGALRVKERTGRSRLGISPRATSAGAGLVLGAAEAFGKELQGHDVLQKLNIILPSRLLFFARLRMNAHLQGSALVAQPHLTRAPHHTTAALRAVELRPRPRRHLGSVLGAAKGAGDRDAVTRLFARVENDALTTRPSLPRDLQLVQYRCPSLLLFRPC